MAITGTPSRSIATGVKMPSISSGSPTISQPIASSTGSSVSRPNSNPAAFSGASTCWSSAFPAVGEPDAFVWAPTLISAVSFITCLPGQLTRCRTMYPRRLNTTL